MKNKIKCPSCGFVIDVDEVLQHQAEETIKNKYDNILKQKESDIKKELEREKEVIKSSAREEYELQIKQLEWENEKRKSENKELKKKELELLKRENELKEKQEDMKLELEKEMLEKRESIKSEAVKSEQQKNELKFKEYEKRLEDQMKLIEEMKRKAEQGSTQMQGEVQELILEDILKNNFPIDEISEVPKGISGADVIQKVKNALGQYCGTIIWESKRTKNWSSSWIPKLKDDQRSMKAEIAVLLTSVLPQEIDNFGLIDNVWVTNYQSLLGLNTALRISLIETEKTKKSLTGVNEKMGILYKYIYGTEFKQRIEAIVENFHNMKSDLDREKTAMEKIWAKREKQIQNVISNTVGMYGDLEGIIGKSIPQIDSLELKSLAEGDEET